jgi:hypothetical protein
VVRGRRDKENITRIMCCVVVFAEPSSLKSPDASIFDSHVPSNKSSFSRGDERRHEAAVPPLAVSSSRPEKRDSRVSTSSQEQKSTNVR